MVTTDMGRRPLGWDNRDFRDNRDREKREMSDNRESVARRRLG